MRCLLRRVAHWFNRTCPLPPPSSNNVELPIADALIAEAASQVRRLLRVRWPPAVAGTVQIGLNRPLAILTGQFVPIHGAHLMTSGADPGGDRAWLGAETIRNRLAALAGEGSLYRQFPRRVGESALVTWAAQTVASGPNPSGDDRRASPTSATGGSRRC